jgi:hypothetical protein
MRGGLGAMQQLADQEERLQVLFGEVKERLNGEYGPGHRNPAVLLERLGALQTQAERVADKVKQLGRAKEELAAALRDDPCAAIGRLAAAGAPEALLSEAARAQAAAEAALAPPAARAGLREGASEALGEALSAVAQLEVFGDDTGAAASAAAPSSTANSAAASPAASSAAAASKENEAAARNAWTVEQAAFNALPESTRGRTRLAEAQATLAIVVNATKAKRRGERPPPKGKSPPPVLLSLKELDRLGAKVVGHSGSCVLASLRQLGLITQSKAGVALAQPPQ